MYGYVETLNCLLALRNLQVQGMQKGDSHICTLIA